MKAVFKLIFSCLVFILFFGFENNARSQSLQFCENVSSNGAPIAESSVFNISDKGGYFKFLVTLPFTVGTQYVNYEIYKIDSEGNETYESTINHEVDASWTWFWKEVTFYKAGRYNVYVYDGVKNFLTSAQVRIQFY